MVSSVLSPSASQGSARASTLHSAMQHCNGKEDYSRIVTYTFPALSSLGLPVMVSTGGAFRSPSRKRGD